MLTPQQIKILQKVQQMANPVLREKWMRFFQLPEDLQEAIFSERVNQKILEITKQKQLMNFQTSILFSVIGSFLSGEIPPNKLTATIQEECVLEEIEAKELIGQLAKDIFAPLKESLRKIYDGSTASEVKTTEPRPSVPIQQPPTTKSAPPQPTQPSPPASPASEPHKFFVPKLDGNVINLRDLE